MNLFKTSLEKRLAEKFSQEQEKIRTSFSLIRQDLQEMQKTIELIKKYIKNKEKTYLYSKNKDNKIREDFRKQVEEFKQKTKTLSTTLSKIREVELNLVTTQNLALIEEKIRTSFKNDIEDIRKQSDECKKFQKEFEKRILKNEKTIENIKKDFEAHL